MIPKLSIETALQTKIEYLRTTIISQTILKSPTKSPPAVPLPSGLKVNKESMLPEKQLQLLQPFFERYQSDLLKLKKSSVSIHNNPFTVQETQLFYPWGQRKIFHHVSFTQTETKALNQLKTIIIEKEQFPINQFTDENILRSLHSQSLDLNKAFQRLKKVNEAFTENQKEQTFLKYLHKDNYDRLQKQLKQGVIYTLGKSSQKSLPIIVLQVKKINTELSHEQNFSLLYTLISSVLHYRMKPHWQQKYIFIIDLGCLSFSQIPYQYMYKFMEKIGLIFGGLCEKIFVYNSEKIGLLWHMCKKWLPETTVNKICFVNKDNLSQVEQIIDLTQLQNKYGGTIRDIKQFWPPKNTSYHEHNQSIMAYDIVEQENLTEYLSFKSNSRFQESILPSAKYMGQNTYKSIGIRTKKQISFYTQENEANQEYLVEKQESNQKCSSLCGLNKGNCQNDCEIF